MASTLRTAYALIIPFALLLPLIALDLSNVMFGYGAARTSVRDFAVALALFAPGLVLSPPTTWCCAASTPSSAPGRCSGCSA